MTKRFTHRLLFAAIFSGFSFLSNAQDTTPPVFDPFWPEIDVECSDVPNITVTATDDSGDEVVITYSDASFSGGCTDNILRTYVATDSSGNQTTDIQILVVTDETPPIFIGAGEDMMLSCDEALPEIPDVIVYDECTETEIEDYDFQTEFEETTCETIIRWIWSATDECGTYGEFIKTITIVDMDAPEFDQMPDDGYIGCEDEYPPIPEVTATDNCTDVTITYEEELVEGGEGEASYCTAQDVSYFGSSFSMKLISSPAQEDYTTSDLVLMHNGETATLSGNVYGFDNPNAGWFIYMEFENGMDWDEWSTQDFPTDYRDDFNIAEETHLDWTYFLLNSTESYFMGLGDYEGSELQLSHNPPNYYYGFQLGVGASNFTTNYGISGWFQATGTFLDAGSDDPAVQEGIEFDYAGDIYTDFNCCPVESLIRTWTAEDECENISQIQQVITKIDVISPSFTYVPEDLLLDCVEEVPLEMAEATDNCSEPTVTYSDEIIETECASEYTINRTFTAMDACGLTTTVTQIITVTDDNAPVLTPIPEDLVLDCSDELPEAPLVTAEDECDGLLDVIYTEEIIGEQAPEGSSAFCHANTPINSAQGWASVLFDPEFGDILTTAEGVDFTQYETESGVMATLTGTLPSMDNENAGWIMDVTLVNGMNWEEWSNQTFPTSYKDDLEIAGDEYENWMYFILETGTLTGYGDWEGASLELSHAPDILYYGFQLGHAAANVNAEYGIGGWMYYEGTLVDGEGNLVEVSGAGDLAFDLDCCPRYYLERTWSAVDCAGNETSHTQTITFEELEADEFMIAEQPLTEPSLAGRYFHEIIQLTVTPNPLVTESKIKLTSDATLPGELSLYNTQGLKIKSLWTGTVESEKEKSLELNRNDLEPGIYILRYETSTGSISEKVLVQE